MNKSFTLIEILVVIVVIGIISSFIIVGLSSVSDKANIAKGQVFSNSLRNSLLMNLVSEWKLDGNANDSWGINNGTWHGSGGSYASPSWRTSSECVSGGCLAFDGTDDYISIPNNDTLNFFNGITIEGWFYLNSNILDSTYPGMIVKGHPNQYSLYLYPDNRLWFVLWIDGARRDYSNITDINTFPANQWNYIVAARESSGPIRVYINSQLIYNNSGHSGNIGVTTNNLYIGLQSNYFNGLIDDVKIYNQAIPISQVQQNYYSGLTKLYKNKLFTKIEYNQKIVELE
jgi:prepilin-type N-terminal cleavage/methylation domain-containing protein